MTPQHERLDALSGALHARLRCGIEKESLRVTRDGKLAMTSHPRALGSPLTHPHITTDFSESQVEMVTETHASAAACLEALTYIHQLVYRHIGDELLWCASMPCELPADDEIPIARFGTSNTGRLKSVYRTGLAHRYGRRMQTISGIHYNFSLPEAAWCALRWDPNDGYFSLMRNFRRHAWLLLYLFCASPAVCASFMQGRAHNLKPLGPDTLHAPHGTTLRMGPLGYQSATQAALGVSYNSLECYAGTLASAMTGTHPAYEAIGIGDGGNYRQLATSLLQIENEFYSTIRPKRRTHRGERPLHALRARGVEYVEVRTIDLDPFSPIGIDIDTIGFLDVFLLHCLLKDSPPGTAEEDAAIARNQHLVSERGREPHLMLEGQGQRVELSAWALQILGECEPIAAALDAHAGGGHVDALSAAVAALRDPALLPSTRMLHEIARNHAGSFTRFALARSLQHARALLAMQLPAAVKRRYSRIAQRSLTKQREMEAADALPFEDFRRDYVSRDRTR